MQDAPQLPDLKVPKWPFFLADAFMLGLAWFLFCWQARLPLTHWEIVVCCVCVFLAAVLGILPFLLEYRAVVKYGALVKLIDSNSLIAASEKIQNLETCIAQIGSAAEQLKSAQAQADKTTHLAGQITERMTEEVKSFAEFMQRAGEGERATLRLEVEKLRRGGQECVSVLVFFLDHIFALNQAAERSGQENLIKQLSQFQSGCRDAARRVGLIPVSANSGETFDAKRHMLGAESSVPASGVIGETLACGYSYQGNLIRPVLVKPRAETSTAPSDAVAEQNQLPYGATESSPG